MWLFILFVMRKLEKLKENYDFRRLYNKGTACVSPAFVLYFRKGRTGRVRIGLTAGKKIGGAVERNRAKRVMVAAFNSCLAHIPQGYEFVIVARTRLLSLKSTQVAAIMEKQLRAADIWCDDEHCE